MSIYVPLYGQEYPMSCWAASIRMIVAAHLASSSSINSDDDVAAPTNDQASLLSGLDPNSTTCLNYWGFSLTYPMSYTEDGFYQLVLAHGPLWVACDVRFPGASRSCPHIRVVTAVASTGPLVLAINDPGQVGVGSIYNEAYTDFVAKNELLGTTELSQPSPIYIAYM
jgi:hypothetical protein